MAEDVRWQQRFSNYRKALERLEDFLEPPALNEREQQELVKAFEYTYELAWNTLRDLLRSQGDASLLMLQDRNLTSHTYNRATADAIAAQIIGCYLPCFQQLRSTLEQRLLQLLTSQPQLQAVWLFGSRAMGRHQQGSDIDLCLDAPQLSHGGRLCLMVDVDDLLLPWRVDLALRHELPADLEAHVQRVGRCLWRKR